MCMEYAVYTSVWLWRLLDVVWKVDGGGGCWVLIGGLFHGVVVACRGISLEGFW